MSESIYHEKQLSALCGVHALNNLLQGPYYGAGDLADVARAIDARELALLSEDPPAPAAAAAAPGDPFPPPAAAPATRVTSQHVDETTGEFSIEVLGQAGRASAPLPRPPGRLAPSSARAATPSPPPAPLRRPSRRMARGCSTRNTRRLWCAGRPAAHSSQPQPQPQPQPHAPPAHERARASPCNALAWLTAPRLAPSRAAPRPRAGRGERGARGGAGLPLPPPRPLVRPPRDLRHVVEPRLDDQAARGARARARAPISPPSLSPPLAPAPAPAPPPTGPLTLSFVCHMCACVGAAHPAAAAGHLPRGAAAG